MNKNKKMRPEAREGFTLIEVLLVVVIIGILAALVVPKLGGRVGQAQEAAAKSDIGAIGTALDLYEVDNGKYPSGIQGLVTKPGGALNWRGPYLKKGVPKDPWGNEYLYTYPGQHGDYDLKSFGPDGAASGDDLVSWE